MASFITTDQQLQENRGCYFPMQAMLPEGFSLSQFKLCKIMGIVNNAFIMYVFKTSNNHMSTTVLIIKLKKRNVTFKYLINNLEI